MQSVSVICSFNNDGKIRPLYFGIVDEEIHRIKIERILKTSQDLGYRDAYFAGTTVRYLDKIVFACECVIYGQRRVLNLIFDPQKTAWYLGKK